MIRLLSTTDLAFPSQLTELLTLEEKADQAIEQQVSAILSQVKTQGDKALLALTQQFDRINCYSFQDIEISNKTLWQALKDLPASQQEALQFAASRIRTYHKKQAEQNHSWGFTDEFGNHLGQRVTPIDRVGIYVPGGKAAYPSSVLMNAIPAQVAGVKHIIMTVPTPDGIRNPLVLAAAYVAGVHQVLTIGGAQAIAALAYGTESIQAVDKIVGPGNTYVARAKKQVFGIVGIDMVAGPSEILVIADDTANPDWIAMDLFSQAEHDELAQSILITPSSLLIEKVKQSIQKLLPVQPRRDIIEKSLQHRGALIQVQSMEEAITLCNRIAPEHLEIATDNAQSIADHIKHAGAIFIGHHSNEALGDYCAGPNHVLPTSSTARFSSPLGVYDFQKRSSIISMTPSGASILGKNADILAQGEGLSAHAMSARMRITQQNQTS